MELEEQILRQGRRGRQIRPFCCKAGVTPRGYSGPLQRVLTDFGAEESFGRAAARVKEHYGIEVPVTAVRQITYQHARKIEPVKPAKPRSPAQALITEMDGSMVPLMRAGQEGDARKGKSVFWSEARLCCARQPGQSQRLYGATLGSAETAAWVWQQTAERAGLGPQTLVHGVGDGAPWIAEKFQDNFGAQGRYLVDFYHVSECLGAAAQAIAGAKSIKWLHKQKDKLLHGKVAQVLKTLQPHVEDAALKETPVRDAFTYLQPRRAHLHYDWALARGLPIGSGEVESGHRHVIQQRLKIAGAWWQEKNAQRMLALRVARANHCWESYWRQN